MQLRFLFDQPDAFVEASCNDEVPQLTLGLANALLDGCGEELWQCSGDGAVEQYDDLLLWRSDAFLCGVSAVAVGDGDLAAVSARLYRSMLQVSAGYELHRFWNFIPDINGLLGDVDRYMSFCVGRADALDNHSDPLQGERLPPASAVGTSGRHLSVAFIAGRDPLTPVENPLQVPAYQYPSRYGPRSPSFARAGVIDASGELLISGTASIRASESLHIGDFVCQGRTAIENLSAVSEASGFPGWIENPDEFEKTVRIYVKDPQQWFAHGKSLLDQLSGEVRQFNVVQADICRPELLVEMEALVAQKMNDS